MLDTKNRAQRLCRGFRRGRVPPRSMFCGETRGKPLGSVYQTRGFLYVEPRRCFLLGPARQ
jgi:hypothetical protein